MLLSRSASSESSNSPNCSLPISCSSSSRRARSVSLAALTRCSSNRDLPRIGGIGNLAQRRLAAARGFAAPLADLARGNLQRRLVGLQLLPICDRVQLVVRLIPAQDALEYQPLRDQDFLFRRLDIQQHQALGDQPGAGLFLRSERDRTSLGQLRLQQLCAQVTRPFFPPLRLPRSRRRSPPLSPSGAGLRSRSALAGLPLCPRELPIRS